MTFYLQDGKFLSEEYVGRELMWDFAKDADVLRGLIPGLPIPPEQYDRLVAAIATLEGADSVDALVRLTLATNGREV